MSNANSERRHRKVIMTMLVGAAIGLGSGVVGAAPASAAPNTIGPNPNPYSTLSGGPRETAPAGSPALTAEIDRGLRDGLTARLPGLPAAK
jgi:hypothetical protein